MSIFGKEIECLNFLLQKNRRTTFKKWIFSDRDACNADKMAEAGFIFIGNKAEPDAVKCFFCGKSLDGWDPTDDPWQEHLKHAPKCMFAKLQTAEENLTPKQLYEIGNELNKAIINNYFDKRIEEIEKFYDAIEHEIKSKLDSRVRVERS